MTQTRNYSALIASVLTSAFLGAAMALLLSATLSSPTSNNVRVTRIEPANRENNYFVDLGILGGCTNIPIAVTSDRAGPDCSSTQVGYEAALLLPYNINGDENGELPPYSLTRAYPAVVSGDSKSMVIVPIATAFEILGLLLNIIAAGCGNPLFGWVAIFWIALAMILSWASFGVTYRFTDKVQFNLGMYNQDLLAVIDAMIARRGNAVWFILASAILLTLALVGMAYTQHSKRRAKASSPHLQRKRSTEATEMS